MFALLADDVVKCAADTVAVVVVVTVDVVKEISVLVTALLGCRDIDGSEGEHERALLLSTFNNSVVGGN